MKILDIKNSPGAPIEATQHRIPEWINLERRTIPVRNFGEALTTNQIASFALTRSEIASLAANFPELVKDEFQAAATEIATLNNSIVDPVNVAAIETIIRKHLGGVK